MTTSDDPQTPIRTGPYPMGGLIVCCPWCGIRMAGGSADGYRCCSAHGWFVVTAYYNRKKLPYIEVKTSLAANDV